MAIIKEFNNNYSLNQTKDQSQYSESLEFNKRSKIADYFDSIYSYPSNIKLKWNNLDELHTDLFLSSNYGVFQHSFPFIDFVEDWFSTEHLQEGYSKKYSTSQYINGFLDKINSSNFFLKKTKKIQTSLTNIPTFVILNGQGEIVLSKPSNVLSSKTPTTYINEKLYDLSGAFDSRVEKNSELGLFFMEYEDAENYLKEVARSDFEGTKTVGLSIHCISLDSAYRITREYHPGIDFRFVPNFAEVKELLSNKTIGKSNLVIEDEQQQLRFRRRSHNYLGYLNKLGLYLSSPTSSFLQNNEYFKGVPIYVVQLQSEPRNFLVEKYFNIIGMADHIYAGCLQYIDNATGFGHNWIMQGSIQDANNSESFKNYIFFEKDQAIKFSQNNGRKVVRYNGGRTSNVKFIVRKPKIFVYNLEDFLEDWEDNILITSSKTKAATKTLFDCKDTSFIAPNTSIKKVDDFFQDFEKTPLKTLRQSLSVKFRVLTRAAGVFFSV